jgi:hypothetical protein
MAIISELEERERAIGALMTPLALVAGSVQATAPQLITKPTVMIIPQLIITPPILFVSGGFVMMPIVQRAIASQILVNPVENKIMIIII